MARLDVQDSKSFLMILVFCIEKGTLGTVHRIIPKGHKISIKNGNIVIEWDLKNFKPTEDLMVVFKNGYAVLGIDYHDLLYKEDLSGYSKEELRRMRNLPLRTEWIYF